MTPEEAIGYIENYTWSTTRLGLDRTRELLHAIGDPQKRLKFIHVAGSNGKGSTCAMLDAVLRAAGFRTGLYISPYIQDFCERIQVNGQNIPGEALARITEAVRSPADAMEDHPSQFELVTSIAMQYFLEQHCDIVVLEVGMGGELDSTNVIDCPEAAVITNIGLEHTEYLGSTLTLIAKAKGGIVKPGCPAVCYDSEPETMQTLLQICEDRQAELHVSYDADVQSLSYGLDGQRFLWKGREYALSLLGAHQLRNAAVVLETISVLRTKGWRIPEAAVSEGLRTVRWPARFEVLSREPLFLLDGGHNPQCAEAMARNLRDYLPGRKLTFLLGVLADKDYRQMLQIVSPYAKEFICVLPDSPRALQPRALRDTIAEMGFPAVSCDTVEDGIRLALQSGGPVIAFGSLYLAGHVRTVFPKLLKREQRRTALRRRDALPEETRAAFSRTVCEKLLALQVYREAGSILLYRAFRSELDLSLFEQQAALDGKTLLYPRCEDDGSSGAVCRRMLAVRPGGTWETDRYGISVPVLSEAAVWDPAEIDLVLCPCSAFDAEGRRLGMGGGYYDRFLPLCTKAFRILTAFEAQCLPRVCTESTDAPMDAVVTEERTLAVGRQK
ncbi:MAG: 5-formyltetrahydrofolate cyclo-ligase [Oscillospiraceae bacterium]|nr:5-formyltetrahydrofolate cyclo-ligase [Oscillospiraceae bacterium]